MEDSIKEDIDYLFSKINWGASFLDAKAIRIMNGLQADIQKHVDVSDEVIKIWNEDGEAGPIQMKTPIAWYRALRKAEAANGVETNIESE